MGCDRCGADTVVLAVPDSVEGDRIEVCTLCLSVEETADPTAGSPQMISAALPAESDQAVPVLLLVDALTSIATNRSRIETLVERGERAGCDPLLVIDRLIDDTSLDPAVDLPRRRHQLEDILILSRS
ncbi:MAG: DUF6276 family protein [Natrialbaceae archaeon]|nr:DUF6276 family protein [Natrialbaceae archaeon]